MIVHIVIDNKGETVFHLPTTYYIDYLYGLYFLYNSVLRKTGSDKFVWNSVESWHYRGA